MKEMLRDSNNRNGIIYIHKYLQKERKTRAIYENNKIFQD
jgi:hypothetical protein